MTGLNKITEKILEEARQDAAEILRKAEEECAAISAEYAQKAENIRVSVTEKAKNEAAGIVFRAKSGESMEKRNTLLAARGEMIDLAYATAKKQLLSLPDEKYMTFLTMLLSAAVSQRAEAEKISRTVYGMPGVADCYEVLMNSRDAGTFGEAVIAAAQKKETDTEKKVILSKIRLSGKNAAIEGGLILRCDDVEINCSVKAIFDEIRPATERKVGGILFPEKKG